MLILDCHGALLNRGFHGIADNGWAYSAASLGAFATSRWAVSVELLRQLVASFRMEDQSISVPTPPPDVLVVVWSEPAFFFWSKIEGLSSFSFFLKKYFSYLFSRLDWPFYKEQQLCFRPHPRVPGKKTHMALVREWWVSER